MVEPWEMAGLTITAISATCMFFIFLYFVNRLLKVRRTTRELLPFFGIAAQYLLLSLSNFIAIAYDYLYWESLGSIIRIDLLKISLILNFAGYGALTFLCELVLKKTKYIFSILVGLLSVLVIFAQSVEQISITIIILGPLFLPSFIVWYFVFIKPTSGFLRRRMNWAFFGLFLILGGMVTRGLSHESSSGVYFGSAGTIGYIIGLSLIGYGFAAFSTFTDLRWKDKLRELFVISPNGTCLYAFSFDQDLPIEDSDLVAGGFSGIQLLLSEMVKTSESLQLIDYQNVKIMIEQKAAVMCILIIKAESKFLQFKLKTFADEFQHFFKDTLAAWKGEIHVFQPTKVLIENVFELHKKT